jgi:D-galactonate transporter
MKPNPPAFTATPEFEKATYAKVTRRMIPFLFLCYVLAYVDRVNISFAKLEMQQDLGMSDSVYGMGAGIFFIGYFFFEVPANMIMQRLGARLWLGPIMAVWGIVSAAMMFVTNATNFYALRFLLGVVESGFFPGVILYLTYWYTRKHRAKMVAAFMTAIPLSGMFASPLSGWILKQMTGVGHLQAWQWLFVVEGLPSIVMGLVTLYYLTDGPAKAKWLTQDEKTLLQKRLDEEEEAKKLGGEHRHTLADAFKSGKVWLLCVVYYGMTMGNYGLGFWLPQTVKDGITPDPFKIGLILIIPWAIAAVAMVLYGHHSDATGERRWHVAVAVTVAAVSLAVSSIPGISGIAGLVALTFAVIGIMCALVTFWSLPTGLLSGSAAAAGIAWINSVGNLGGYVGPYAVGAIRDATGSMTWALLALSAACLLSAVMALTVGKPGQARP